MISKIVQLESLSCNQVSNDIESFSDIESDVLILGRMFYGILADKLKRTIAVIFLEDSDGALGKGNAESLLLGIVKLNFA